MMSLLIFCFLFVGCVCSDKLGVAECKELGFNEGLLCSLCSDLDDFVSNPDVVRECHQCCEEEDKESLTHADPFDKVVLVVSKSSLARWPHIQEFIKKWANQFKRLEVQYKRGYYPHLVCYKADGSVDETVPVDGWKTEHLTAFLQQKLSP